MKNTMKIIKQVEKGKDYNRSIFQGILSLEKGDSVLLTFQNDEKKEAIYVGESKYSTLKFWCFLINGRYRNFCEIDKPKSSDDFTFSVNGNERLLVSMS